MKIKGAAWWRRLIRPFFVFVVAVLFLGLLAPFVNATYLSGRIRNALESSLGREVAFETAHFTLFSGPGFTLENVTIGEDPRYGIEPFAFVPTLEARLRLDKLLIGQIRFTSLRLVGPSLNIVKKSDGTWNIVQLMNRLSAPRRSPLNLFPSFEVSDGRVDFKFGTRKTTFYISKSDLAVYPERSGKLYVRFSGSPARTDRAGLGFGHFRGNMNWFLAGEKANQLEAEITLDPSDLSELTTLFEGHDVGVHGTVSSYLKVAGPATALNVTGELKVNDVHRWDLFPSSGEDWTVGYAGRIDLLAHHIDIGTVPPESGQATPLGIHLSVGQFLTNPVCSVRAEMIEAPLSDLMPLAARMGVALPNKAKISGALTGVIEFSNTAGWKGVISIQNAEATLPDAPVLRASAANFTIAGDRVQFVPVTIETGSGSLRLSGEYSLSNGAAKASLYASSVQIATLKPTMNAWFGAAPAMNALTDGEVSGQFSYTYGGTSPVNAENSAVPTWSGQFQFADAIISVPGLAAPLSDGSGRVSFNSSSFDLDRFTANLRDQPLHASYRYNALAKHPERIRVSVPSIDLSELGKLLTVEPAGIFARLRITRRATPAWLTARDADGELVIQDFAIEGKPLGQLTAHFLWRGANLDLTDVALSMPEGQISGHGALNLLSYTPQWHLEGKVSGFGWKGGSLNADGQFDTTGIGEDSLRNLKARGSFTAEDVALSATESFDKASGVFDVSLAEGWPDLHLSNIQAFQAEDQWTGNAVSQRDGKLLIDLEHAGRQVRIVSSLTGENASIPLSFADRTLSH